MTTALMLLLLVAYAAMALAGAKYFPDKNDFFGLQDTTALKGLFCIIVLMVHVPGEYQNTVQDAVGSFAYIGVTFFFMTSAFGLMYSAAHKANYIKKFWQQRLPSLLIPALLCNAVGIAVNIFENKPVTVWNIISINAWVKVLLLYYLVFGLITILPEKSMSGGGQ